MKNNQIITPEQIIWKELESNPISLEFIQEISDKINFEKNIQNCYHYILEKSIDKKISTREYSLIKNIFSMSGWVLEMHSQKNMKDESMCFYNVILRPIKQIYL